MTGGTFGPRKTECKYGHSLSDAYIYKREKKGKIYTIRECRVCRSKRNIKFKDRKRKDRPKRLINERLVIKLATLVCGHESVFNPPPKPNDIVWCLRCSDYQVVKGVAA